MKKEEVLADVEKLMHDIDYCMGKFVLARMNRDEDGVRYAHSSMESLMVGSLQELTFLVDYIKDLYEVGDLDKVYENQDKVQYRHGYDKGKHEILTELEKFVQDKEFDFAKKEILLWITKRKKRNNYGRNTFSDRR